MKIEKVINNNVVISRDDDNEMIIVGKGIGYNAEKGSSIPMEKILKIFTLKDENDKNKLQTFIEDIPYDCIVFAEKALEFIEKRSTKKINKRLFLTIVDHISTTLDRYREGIQFKTELLWDIKYLYKEEFEIATHICKMMDEEFNIHVDDMEASFITLHIVNAELDIEISETYKVTNITDCSIKTINEFFDRELDEESVFFMRFITHLQFFAKRLISNTLLANEEDNMKIIIQKEYPKEYACALKIKENIEKEINMKIEESECIYLAIHIARLLK